jgi:hypothetical protein
MVTGLFVRSVLCLAIRDNLISIVVAEHEGSRSLTKTRHWMRSWVSFIHLPLAWSSSLRQILVLFFYPVLRVPTEILNSLHILCHHHLTRKSSPLCLLIFHYSNNIVSFFPVPPTLEHRESVKRFVSLQSLNPKTVCRTPWTRDQPVARSLPTQDNTNTE